MAQVLSLPESGIGLLGMLNLHGHVLPVIDPRPRLGLPSPPPSTEHRLVLVRADAPFLLWVDEVETIKTVVGSNVPQASPLAPRVARLGDDLVPILASAALARP